MTRQVLAVGALSVGAALAVLGSGLYLASQAKETHSSAHRSPDLPGLFGPTRDCPHGASARRAALRAESHGILLSERYPYDPRDGVRAVQRLREAQRCYEASGVDESARRAAYHASKLAARIEADYASSRLALETAMASGKWHVAHDELQRLLRLTAHLRAHPFAEHLRDLAGKVASSATSAR